MKLGVERWVDRGGFITDTFERECFGKWRFWPDMGGSFLVQYSLCTLVKGVGLG